MLPTSQLWTSRAAERTLGVLGVGLALAGWQALSVAGVIPRHDIPPIASILHSLLRLSATAGFWHSVDDTVEGWGLGLAVAVAAGVPAGLVIGSNDLLWRALRPTIEFLRPVPSVALIPLAILLYGSGLRSTFVMTAFGAFWPVLIQAVYGARELDELTVDTARVFHLGRPRRSLHLYLPSAAPFLATGLRIASATALIVAVTSELVISSPGLGNSIAFAQSGGQFTQMYAYILATGLLGLLLNATFTRGERRLLRWHPSQRTGAA